MSEQEQANNEFGGDCRFEFCIDLLQSETVDNSFERILYTTFSNMQLFHKAVDFESNQLHKTWKKLGEFMLAFAMGRHPRLGKASGDLFLLDEGMIYMIWMAVCEGIGGKSLALEELGRYMCIGQ